MNGVDKLTNILSSYIKKDKTYPYDAEGKVKRIDKETGKAYVEFGDYGETPVDMSIDAKPGDLVKVRVSGGDAWIVGNSSAPPTDDRVARQALKTARYGKKEIEKIVKRIDEGDFDVEPGPPGEDAPIITGVVIEYCLATARTIPEGGSFEDIQATDWSEEIPDPVTNQFYWMRTITVMSDGTEVVSDPMFAMSVQASIEAGIAAANAQAAATTAEGIANAANATANTKRRVFNAQPTTPYDKNDIWFDGAHGKIYLCTKEGGRQSGSFTASDWTEYSEDVSNHFWYDSSGAHVAQTQGDVTRGNAQTISANGTVITRDGKLITSWTGTGSSDAAINFYDLDTQTIGDSAHLVASYAKAGITQYINNKIAMALTASGLTFKSPDTNAWTEAVFGPSGADIYANNIKRTSVNSDGMTVYDTDGATPLAAFKGTGVSFNTGKPFTLGNDNSYIKWVYENGAWRIKIAAEDITFGGAEVLTELDKIEITSITYAVSATDTQPSSFPYTSVPTVPEDQWLWTKVAYSDGSAVYSKAKQGKTGPQGTAGHTPSITATKSGKTTTIKADGSTIGTIIDGSDGTSPTVSKSGDTVTIVDGAGHSVTVTDGADGQSIKGDAGDDAYLHIAWANSSDGTTDFSTTVAAGKLYMGTYTDHTQADSTTPSKYKWVKVKGEQGVQGTPGTDGDDGVTFTPSVDSSGNISWTNDGGRTNPTARNIKGPKGDPGEDVTSYYVKNGSYGTRVYKASGTPNTYTEVSDGLHVVRNGTEVAKFADTAVIGQTGSGNYNIEVNSSGIDYRTASAVNARMNKTSAGHFLITCFDGSGTGTTNMGSRLILQKDGAIVLENVNNNTYVTLSSSNNTLSLHNLSLVTGHGYGVRSNSGQLIGESEQGNVLVGWGIKDSGGTLNLYGHGGIYARSKFHAASGGDYTGSWTSTSDKRLKEKIEALNSNVDDVILDLKPVEYDLKEDESGTRYFGLIAQDVAETLEKYGYDSKKYSTVNELNDPEGYLGIDYNDFIPMLIHLCQSQQKKIDDLEERLSKLEGKLE